LGGLGALFEGLSPPKSPRGDGTECKLFENIATYSHAGQLDKTVGKSMVYKRLRADLSEKKRGLFT